MPSQGCTPYIENLWCTWRQTDAHSIHTSPRTQNYRRNRSLGKSCAITNYIIEIVLFPLIYHRILLFPSSFMATTLFFFSFFFNRIPNRHSGAFVNKPSHHVTSRDTNLCGFCFSSESESIRMFIYTFYRYGFSLLYFG